MNNGFVNDALLLCETLFNNSNPKSNWMFLNIAKNILDNKRSFHLTAFPLIKTTYAYFFDDVPELLIEEGVIEKYIKDRWITGKINITSPQENTLTIYAREKKIIKRDEAILLYYDAYKNRSFPFGPKYFGQYAALINLDALKTFYFKYNPPTINTQNQDSLPLFDYDKGMFSFVGKNITIEAPLRKKLLDLLVKNINKVIGDEELYDIRGIGKYKSKTANKTLEKANDANEKLIEELKDELYSIQVFRKALIFVNHYGSGLFIDSRFLPNDSSPQQTP